MKFHDRAIAFASDRGVFVQKPSSSCTWWRAFWHRRLRKFDRRVIYPAIRKAAARKHPNDDPAAVAATLRAWEAFVQQPGQDHWRCPCSVKGDPR